MNLEQIVLLGLVLGWFAISLWSRVVGAAVGMILSALVGVWGFLELAHGNALFVWGMPRPLAPGAFYSLISMMVLVNGMTAIQAWRQRRLERVG